LSETKAKEEVEEPKEEAEEEEKEPKEEAEEEEKEPKEEAEEEEKEPLSERDIMRLNMILDGKDPDAQQMIPDFTDMKNPVESSNLPLKRDVHFVSFLGYVGDSYFPDIPNNPFTRLRDHVSLGYKARGGWRTQQLVEVLRQTPDLSEIGTTGPDVKTSIRDKLLGRGKTE